MAGTRLRPRAPAWYVAQTKMQFHISGPSAAKVASGVWEDAQHSSGRARLHACVGTWPA